ncbi:MAG: D-alanyl-D-alanine carboxypeptidase family protein [Celeribacter sp.]|jgi:D-alanyl-D-alanine carboxypeptidase
MTLGHGSRLGLFSILFVLTLFGISLRSHAAPYAALVIDARSGEVLHSENADSRLHPASLTKMMTLYITFDAVRRGELTLDTKVKISQHAANEPPSKLGLRAGQSIELRYLIRAASVKSANDAATALGEAVSGSEAAFARRMNRTAKAMGMTRTTFKNAHGLTEEGHLSTARDMTLLGRHLFFDFPEYYNLFSRRSTNAGVREVANTNRKFLAAYEGADGIKTGYTRAAGFNLVASAQRGNERIIATVFGGRSTPWRNQRVAELLDLGFKRAPTRVAIRKPAALNYAALPPEPSSPNIVTRAAGKAINVELAVARSIRPEPNPGRKLQAPPETLLLAMQDEINDAVAEIAEAQVAAADTAPEQAGSATELALAEATAAPAIAADATELAVVTLGTRPMPNPRMAAVAVQNAQIAAAPAAPTPNTAPLELADTVPMPRPENISLDTSSVQMAALVPQPIALPRGEMAAEQEIVTRISTSGTKHWGVNVGSYPSQYKAERVLLKTALKEMATLQGSLRKVVRRPTGYDANFLGLSQEQAELACRRMEARGTECRPFGPGSSS